MGGYQKIGANPHVKHLRCIFKKIYETEMILPGRKGFLSRPGTARNMIPCIRV